MSPTPFPPLLRFLLISIHSVTSQSTVLLYTPTKTSHFLLRADSHPYTTVVTPLACCVHSCTMESSKTGEGSMVLLAHWHPFLRLLSQLLFSTSPPGPSSRTSSEGMPARWGNSPCQLQKERPGSNSQWMNAQSQVPRPSKFPYRQAARGSHRKIQ